MRNTAPLASLGVLIAACATTSPTEVREQLDERTGVTVTSLGTPLEFYSPQPERGLQAAEVANLIAIRETAAKVPQWTEQAAALQRAGLALAEAGEKANWQAAQSEYRNVVQACNACHQNVAPDRAPMLKP